MMIQYIELNALVTKIRNKVDSYRGDGIISIGVLKQHCEDFISSLDTYEVKEVDLEKEIGKYLDSNDIEFSHQIKLFEFAKHFFELGMSVSNPTTALDKGMALEIILALKRVQQDYRIGLEKEIKWVQDKIKAQKGE